LTLLRNGGIEPICIAPQVDEDLVAAVAKSEGLINSTADLVGILAKAKAEAVLHHPDAVDALIIGCDSSLEFDGESLGKPHLREVAQNRWLAMRGRSGKLFSGHHLIDNRTYTGEANAASPEKPAINRVSQSTVHFANLSDREIEAYVSHRRTFESGGGFHNRRPRRQLF
jgi:septum formation protein